MKKDRISQVLIQLWSCMDQADLDQMIIDAFKNCPVHVQKKFIKRMFEHGELYNWRDGHPDECEGNLYETIKKLIESEG